MATSPAEPGDARTHPEGRSIELPGGRSIPRSAVRITSITSRGPGGQNVNRRSTRIRLSVSIAGLGLPRQVEARLRAREGVRISRRGNLIITSDRYRSSARNREECLGRLGGLLDRAWTRPRPRRRTKPTKGSRERRLAQKRERSETKARRRPPGERDI